MSISAPISDLQTLLRSMEPMLNAGQYVFATLASPAAAELRWTQAIAVIREPEGLSVVLEEAEAIRLGFGSEPRFAWITLSVNSDLQAVGLTAAFASALGRAGISCNVVAGAQHDHIFVPVEQAARAMDELLGLQRGAGQTKDLAE
jgi:uncharacterized protein